MVEPWYSTIGLEADQVKAKQQTRKNNAMTRDPRTSKPFEESDTLGPVSTLHHNDVIITSCDVIIFSLQLSVVNWM